MKKIKNIYFVILLSGLFCNSIILPMENLENKNNQDSLAKEFFEAAKNNNLSKIQEMLDSGFKDIEYTNENGSTAIIKASAENHKEIVELLIKNKANINHKNNYGNTALMLTSCMGHKEIIELLINNKANIEDKNIDDDTPLMAASCYGHIDIAKLLIKNGANVNHKNNKGGTALNFAAQKGYKEIVELLIEYDASINEKNKNGNTALIIASMNGNQEIVESLLKNGVDVNIKNNNNITALWSAVAIGYTEIVKLLIIQDGIDIDQKSNNGVTSLMMAASEGYEDILKILIQNKADINIKDNRNFSALLIATQYGYKDIVELLLKNNADTRDCDLSGITYLFDLQNYLNTNDPVNNQKTEERFKRILNFVRNINATDPNFDYTILMACLDFIDPNFDNQKFVDIVLENNPNINFKNNSNESVYSVAKKNNREYLIFNYIYKCVNEIKEFFKNPNSLSFQDSTLRFKKLLLKLGSIKIKDKNGNNLLHIAIKFGNFEFVKIIYALCPELISKRNNNDETPLSYMFYEPGFFHEPLSDFLQLNMKKEPNKIIFDEIIEKINNKKYDDLILYFNKNSKNINIQNISGYSPLHFAVRSGNIKMVQLLLKFGADKCIESKFGENSLDIAQKYDYQEISEFLKYY